MPVVPDASPASGETRVLLIEDNASDRRLIEQYLLELPYAIHLETAENITEGKSKADKDNFDCILVDHLLPDGNSLALLKQMTDAHNDPAVIVMSRTDNRDVQQKILAAGASDLINKNYLSKSMLGRVISHAQDRQTFIQKIYKQEEENQRLMAALRDTNAHLDELVELRTAQFKIAQQVAKEKAKQAEQASRVKSEFLATMSHEIRTPLNGVIGMLDLLRTTTLDDEQQEFVTTAQTSAEILLALINDILDISRIEAGRFELEDYAFDLREIIEQVGRILKSRAEAKGLFFTVEISPLLYPQVVGDAVRLRQVLVNLGDNAIKYTDRGNVILRAEQLTEAPDGKEEHGNQTWVRFTVKDSGIGIDPELHQKIFEPFTQVDSSITRRFGGTGLGLAIVHRLVEMLGGDIRVESALGKGSVFTCEMPLIKCAVNESVEGVDRHPSFFDEERLPEKNVKQRKDMYVLLVEDNPTNQLVATNTLEKLGYKYVDCVETGLEALALIKTSPCDLVLMDCQLPEMDGYEVTRRIRQWEKENHLPPKPIIAMTANAMASDRQRCLDAGMSDYIAKPIMMKTLQEVLSLWNTDNAFGIEQ